MTIYSFSEARQKLASVLEKAGSEVKVLIRRRDGPVFVIQPVSNMEFPLNVKGIDLGLSTSEILGIVREARKRQREII